MRKKQNKKWQMIGTVSLFLEPLNFNYWSFSIIGEDISHNDFGRLIQKKVRFIFFSQNYNVLP